MSYKNLRLATVAGERLAELKRERERAGIRLFPFNRYKQTLRKDGTAAYRVYPGGDDSRYLGQSVRLVRRL